LGEGPFKGVGGGKDFKGKKHLGNEGGIKECGGEERGTGETWREGTRRG